MINTNLLHRIVWMVWLLCLGCLMPSAAYAYDRTPASASWGYQPLYSTASTRPNKPAYKLSGDVYPAYRFRSTSPITNYQSQITNRQSQITNRQSPIANYQSPIITGPYKSSEWNWGDPEDEDPIGVVPDPAPIGEPWLLFLLALLYLPIRYYRRSE